MKRQRIQKRAAIILKKYKKHGKFEILFL